MNKKKVFVFIMALFMLAAALGGCVIKAKAESTGYNAKAALLMDYDSGDILYEQNADTRLQIASMVKIMTLNLCFEELDKGTFGLDSDIEVSEHAAGMGGSQAFLDAHCTYKAGELIKSIIVASANDSCVAMAEHIAGSVEGFVARMNEKAKALNLSDTNFVNCTGLPAPNEYSSAHDVGVMARELFSHPQFFDYSNIWMFDFVHPSGRTTSLTNTNKLVRFYEGCDGGKTGFTNEALSCLAATATRNGSRFISVIIGAPTAKERNAEVSKMFNNAFAAYETKHLVVKGTEMGEIEVANGKQKTVSYVAAADFKKLIVRGGSADVSFNQELSKVAAPVKAGDVVGKLTVIVNGEVIGSVDLTAAADVGKRSYLDVIDHMIGEW